MFLFSIFHKIINKILTFGTQYYILDDIYLTQNYTTPKPNYTKSNINITMPKASNHVLPQTKLDNLNSMNFIMSTCSSY